MTKEHKMTLVISNADDSDISQPEMTGLFLDLIQYMEDRGYSVGGVCEQLDDA